MIKQGKAIYFCTKLPFFLAWEAPHTFVGPGVLGPPGPPRGPLLKRPYGELLVEMKLLVEMSYLLKHEGKLGVTHMT